MKLDRYSDGGLYVNDRNMPQVISPRVRTCRQDIQMLHNRCIILMQILCRTLRLYLTLVELHTNSPVAPPKMACASQHMNDPHIHLILHSKEGFYYS